MFAVPASDARRDPAGVITNPSRNGWGDFVRSRHHRNALRESRTWPYAHTHTRAKKINVSTVFLSRIGHSRRVSTGRCTSLDLTRNRNRTGLPGRKSRRPYPPGDTGGGTYPHLLGCPAILPTTESEPRQSRSLIGARSGPANPWSRATRANAICTKRVTGLGKPRPICAYPIPRLPNGPAGTLVQSCARWQTHRAHRERG